MFNFGTLYLGGKTIPWLKFPYLKYSIHNHLWSEHFPHEIFYYWIYNVPCIYTCTYLKRLYKGLGLCCLTPLSTIFQYPGETRWRATSHWQTWSHNATLSTSRHERGSNSQLIKWWWTQIDCIGSSKSNYHMITTTMALTISSTLWPNALYQLKGYDIPSRLPVYW